jgi:hypothetical protein
VEKTALIYKFKSKAGGDVIMLGPQGDQILSLIGREAAPQGVVSADQLPAAIDSLELAVARDEAAFAQAQADAQAQGDPLPRRQGISLRQRAWPLLDLMRRSQAERHDLTWGV